MPPAKIKSKWADDSSDEDEPKTSEKKSNFSHLRAPGQGSGPGTPVPDGDPDILGGLYDENGDHVGDDSLQQIVTNFYFPALQGCRQVNMCIQFKSNFGFY